MFSSTPLKIQAKLKRKLNYLFSSHRSVFSPYCRADNPFIKYISPFWFKGSKMKNLFVFLIGCLISSMVFAEDQKMPPVPVELFKISNQEMVHGVVSTGELKANRAVIIKPEVSGKISKLYAPEGQLVQAGTILIELDESVAAANLKQAQSKFENSKLNYERFQTLAKKGSGATSERDTAFAALRFDEGNVELAKAALEKTRLKAPFSGILGLRQVDIGDYVDPGQALISIDDIDTLLVDFSIPEKYLANIKVNQEVEITTEALPNRKFNAKIYAIAPQIDLITHAIKARASLNNPSLTLRPGLFAKVRVVFERISNAVRIPEQSILNMNNKTYVYLIQNNVAKLTEVKTGIREEGQVEILSGLKNQDIIVKTGLMKLYDGAQIMDVENMPK